MDPLSVVVIALASLTVLWALVRAVRNGRRSPPRSVRGGQSMGGAAVDDIAFGLGDDLPDVSTVSQLWRRPRDHDTSHPGRRRGKRGS